MAITDSQKIDYLYKKLGYGVTKTDTSANKSPSNEAIPSPLMLRADKVWVQSYNIPGVVPASNTAVISLYNDSLTSTVQAVVDNSVTGNKTWKTNLSNWITPEYGSTYQIKIYAAPNANSAPQTYGVQLFPDGSGNNDSWYFDYQSGVLNFADTNVPTAVTGNVIYVSGARYTGNVGINNSLISTTANLGNIQIVGSTISSTFGNLTLTPGSNDANNVVVINSTSAIDLPTGPTSARPVNAIGGSLRYNSDNNNLEVFITNTGWVPLINQITTQAFTPDGTTTTFTLSAASTTNAVIVSINGTLQQPGTAYTVSGTNLIFAEVPKTTDIIEVRNVSAAVASFPGGNIAQATTVLDTTSSTSTATGALVVSGGTGIAGNLNVGGNVVISGNLQVASTTGTPTNTSTPAGWLKVKVGNSYYYQPLYQ